MDNEKTLTIDSIAMSFSEGLIEEGLKETVDDDSSFKHSTAYRVIGILSAFTMFDVVLMAIGDDPAKVFSAVCS